MYELYPYFTNDGSVGLFSRQDDDIYHSAYGALSESWQKFILPAHLQEYLLKHDSVKILDICYGIGYNTKTALQTFLNVSEKKYKNNLKNKKVFSKNFSHPHTSIAAIDTDNIYREDFEQIYTDTPLYNAEIYSDNISSENKTVSEEKISKIFIDAVDTDKILMQVSPFITNENKNYFFCNKNNFYFEKNCENKFEKIKKIKKNKKLKLEKKYKIKNEVLILIFQKLIQNNPEFFDKILTSILYQKKISPFLSKFMLNFARFYQNQGYNNNKNLNNSTFLHNIYYRYISKSYKNAKKYDKNNKITLNFHHFDARKYVKTTKNTYDFIFLDAFTPSKCPCLWALEFFEQLYSKLEDDGMILTYSNSAAVRNAFLKSGFFVGKTFDSKLNKFIGTVASKNPDLIEHKLNEQDLELMKSKAGICYRDENLAFDNHVILANRDMEIERSELKSSSQVLKGTNQ
ncbi:MAG TPA: MnmC family methyltransferase [Candidatus Gastranaerophilaceae bacterium]|nr:MnmC family methyltransferase [Candidatus Gastranaerophilaceae bacterium]